MLKVVVFGDSICVGQFVSPHLTWVTRIAQKLDEEFGDDVWVNNASHSGDTTRLALERMAYDVLNHGLDVLLIQFGLNDCNYWVSDRGHPRVAPAAFQENLREMIARARGCGAREIVLVTNHPTLRTETFEHIALVYQECNEQYNRLIRRVAEQEAVALIDIETAWQSRLASGGDLHSLLLADRVHLARAGHDLYLSLVYPPLAHAARTCLCSI